MVDYGNWENLILAVGTCSLWPGFNPWFVLNGQDRSIDTKPDLQSLERSNLTASEVCFWYGPLASPSLQIASVALEYHGKNNWGPNQWIVRVKITPRLLKIHLAFLNKSSWILDGLCVNEWLTRLDRPPPQTGTWGRQQETTSILPHAPTTPWQAFSWEACLRAEYPNSHLLYYFMVKATKDLYMS